MQMIGQKEPRVSLEQSCADHRYKCWRPSEQVGFEEMTFLILLYAGTASTVPTLSCPSIVYVNEKGRQKEEGTL